MNNIVTWNYDESVRKVSAKVKEFEAISLKKSTLTDEIARYLYEARKELSNSGKRSDLVTNDTRFTWNQYLEDVGLQRMSVHRWLEQYDPNKKRLLTSDELKEKKHQKYLDKKEKTRVLFEKVLTRLDTDLIPENWDKASERLYNKAIKEKEQSEKDQKNTDFDYGFEKAQRIFCRLSGSKTANRKQWDELGNDELKMDIFYDIIDGYLSNLERDESRREALQVILKYTTSKISQLYSSVA